MERKEAPSCILQLPHERRGAGSKIAKSQLLSGCCVYGLQEVTFKDFLPSPGKPSQCYQNKAPANLFLTKYSPTINYLLLCEIFAGSHNRFVFMIAAAKSYPRRHHLIVLPPSVALTLFPPPLTLCPWTSEWMKSMFYLG